MKETIRGTQAGERQLGLTEIRENRGISVGQIADSTKISRRFLECIECERFEELPGGVYDVSYIRQYAAAIGYDESTLLAHYRRWKGLETPVCPQEGRDRLRTVRNWFLAPAATQR